MVDEYYKSSVCRPKEQFNFEKMLPKQQQRINIIDCRSLRLCFELDILVKIPFVSDNIFVIKPRKKKSN